MTEEALPGSAIPSPKEIDMIKESQPEGCGGESQPDPQRTETSEIEDAVRAGMLLARAWSGGRPLHESDAEWLREWPASHVNPSRHDYNVGRARRIDLGVYMEGAEVLGAFSRDELVSGNVNVAGGWAWRVESVEDENGWPRGYKAELCGLDAFLEAMGLESVEGSGDLLGPFRFDLCPSVEEVVAYKALATRMLAALVHVSRAALDQNSQAQPRIRKQQAEFEERLWRGMAEAESIWNPTEAPRRSEAPQ